MIGTSLALLIMLLFTTFSAWSGISLLRRGDGAGDGGCANVLLGYLSLAMSLVFFIVSATLFLRLLK